MTTTTDDARARLEAAIAANEAQLEAIEPTGDEADTHRRARLALDAALDRLDRGEYGTCRRCGEPIPAARLELVPEADLCVACAQAPHGLLG